MSDLKDNKALLKKGFIMEALPSTLFRVRFEGSNETEEKDMLAYLGGKMRLHRIKVLVGDQVEVLIDPYGGKGRIVKRL